VPFSVYYHSLSTFSQRVRIVLLEKNVPTSDYALVELDFLAREHKGPAFLAKNPYGRVPVLEEDGFVLLESTAILEYLEARYPSPPLVPADARGRALVAMHMKLCDLEFGVWGRDLIFPARFLPRERWNPEAMDKARAAIERHLQITDGMLGDRTWLLGDAYSLADVCYTPMLRFLDELGLQGTPRIRAYAERLLARPSVRATWLPR
jgi:glutathione S-transferase